MSFVALTLLALQVAQPLAPSYRDAEVAAATGGFDPTPDWVVDGFDRHHPQALVVRGTVELTPAEADAAALAAGNELIARGVDEAAAEVIATRAPRWWPSFVEQRVISRWRERVLGADFIAIVDRHREVHDHGGLGRSFRTNLLLDADETRVGAALTRLRRDIPRATRELMLRCGGVIGFWAVLALAYSWLDRLTRGYMTGRLRVLGAAFGLLVPVAVLCL